MDRLLRWAFGKFDPRWKLRRSLDDGWKASTLARHLQRMGRPGALPTRRRVILASPRIRRRRQDSDVLRSATGDKRGSASLISPTAVPPC